MSDLYIVDQPTHKSLNKLSSEVQNIDQSSVLTYLDMHNTYQEMKSHYDTLLQRYNLTQSRFTIMMLLYRENNHTLSPSHLAKKVNAKKSTITGIVDGLERKNWITKVASQNDKRSKSVKLTQEGEDILLSFLPYNYDYVARVFKYLSNEERDKLSNLLLKIRKGINALSNEKDNI
ncbi:MarR family transcriptional regulator [Staphylococcus massiliensis]|uniref:MarR family winged helix-turn-helix transcriptional regulator n=1 Tax=Staphylococcus massiliensis TaxID=555791 RepID=UPI001EDC9EF1|nr:MarR family transcriptional regulator [Staphylococcus massiliensis]MCG3413108.1 MarR family transcriptional regulator [Staphylococcus massiliensis]